MEERKYGQRGYREYEKGQPAKPAQPSKPTESSGPRAPAMPQARTVSRCVDCGTTFPPLTDSLVQCPKCGAALHSCRQCAHFDPGRRFECAQPIAERITNKNAANTCTLFSLHATVERETSLSSSRPDDGRRALDNLFKKK
jgi:hypothetical protein